MGTGQKIERALIFGSAPCEDWSFLERYLDRPFRVFCADGGVNAARAAGLTPEVIIGDWDSGGAPAPGAQCTTLPAEKDMTDLQAAADLALEQGCRELLLCGCTGGPRLDHTASNLVLLEYVARRGGRGFIADEDNEVRLLECGRDMFLNVPPFRYFSLIPLDRQVMGVTLVGAKYPLKEATLTRGCTFSVSNEPAHDRVEITIREGHALLIRSERIP